MIKTIHFMLVLGCLLFVQPLWVQPAAAATSSTDPERWGDYLDFAYVYSSADPEALTARLDEYGREAGVSLDDYIANFLIDPLAPNAEADETTQRRRSIAHLLKYLATRDPALIDLASEHATKLSQSSDSYQSRERTL